MIHVKPATGEQIAEIFDNNLFDGANAMIATDTETGEVVGHSKFSIIDGVFTIHDVCPSEKDIWLCDLISRATMNYAINRGILLCNLDKVAPKGAFLLLRYIENEQTDCINIIQLFTMCKNCSKGAETLDN
ncbi:MAG: hypothetical protein IJO58_04830 [Clostridia bacterium]|nr:hypothetical protein [Clostridia bacterium]MBQ9847111.1 hypothetical protein [Clostridia bacterium]MBQ9957951.1 hypothetical protein [Clostridia bacterium]